MNSSIKKELLTFPDSATISAADIEWDATVDLTLDCCIVYDVCNGEIFGVIEHGRGIDTNKCLGHLKNKAHLKIKNKI